jgi:hypothetical protein
MQEFNELLTKIEKNRDTPESQSENQEEDPGQNKEDYGELISQIKDAYAEGIDAMLPDGDPLKEQILDFFVRRSDVENEYNYILSKLSDAERENYPNRIREVLKDSHTFIKKMERFFTVQDIHQSERQLHQENRLATPEEYEMGVYLEFLEPQVREAMVTLNKKGYKTFRSGFSEKDPKDQFVDVYNAEVEVPEDLVKSLEERGVEVRIENFDDRTTVTLHPQENGKVIRLEEWKEIWDYFAEHLEEANPDLVQEKKETNLHSDFRIKQDMLKKIKDL